MDQRVNDEKRRVRSPDFVFDIATKFGNDKQTTVRKLATCRRVSIRNIKTLCRRTWTLKKSLPGGSPHLLTREHENERVWTCEDFVWHGLLPLNGTAGLHCCHGQSAVRFHKWETKQQSKQ